MMVLAFSLAATSCTKDDNNGDDNNGTDNKPKETLLTKLKTVTPLETQEHIVSYNADLLPEKVVTKSSGTVILVEKYTYNGSAITECKKYSDEAMTNLLGTVTYTWDGKGNLTEALKVEGADTTHYTLTYTGGKLTQVLATHPTVAVNDTKIEYEWNGDNVSKQTEFVRDSAGSFTSAGYTLFVNYDDKINPLTIKYLPIFDDAQFLSKNNCLKQEYYDIYGILQGLGQFTYTYTDKDMPATGTFDYGYIAGQTEYSYEDLSKP